MRLAPPASSARARRPAYTTRVAPVRGVLASDSDMRAWTTVQTRVPSPGSSLFAHMDADGSTEMDDMDMFFAGDDAAFALRNTPTRGKTACGKFFYSVYPRCLNERLIARLGHDRLAAPEARDPAPRIRGGRRR